MIRVANLGQSMSLSPQGPPNSFVPNNTTPDAAIGNATSYTSTSVRQIRDFEGLWREVPEDAVAVEHLRPVHNLLLWSNDFSNAAWVKSGSTTAPLANQINFGGAGSGHKIGQAVSVDRNGRSYLFVVTIPAASGFSDPTATVSIDMSGSGVALVSVTPTSEPQRIVTNKITYSSAGSITCNIYTDKATNIVGITAAQSQNVTGQTISTIPDEHVQTTTASVIEYKATVNANQVASNVVTEATGALLPRLTAVTEYGEVRYLDSTYGYIGVLTEPARTNKINGAFSLPGADKTSTTELVTGTDSDMSGANNWTSSNLGTFDVNSTVAGKMYMLGNGGSDTALLPTTLTQGKVYSISLASRLNAGASTEIYVGSAGFTNSDNRVAFTPTGTEGTYTGTFVAGATSLGVGLTTGFNGIAFEIDDVSIKEIGGTDSAGAFVSGLGTLAQAASGYETTIPGMTLSGDAAAILSVVTDEAALVAAGLDAKNPSFKVYKLDNSGGGSNGLVDIAGDTGNTNSHTMSVYGRNSTGDLQISTSAATSAVVFPSASYTRIVSAGFTPSASSNHIRIKANAGEVGYFLIPQLEEGDAVTSPMIVEAATETRTLTSQALNNPVSTNNYQSRFIFTPENAEQGTADNPVHLLGWLFNDGNKGGVSYDGTDFSFFKYVSSGDGLGSELVTPFDFTSGWSTAGTVAIDDADSFTSTGNGGVNKAYLTDGTTYQLVLAGNSSASSIEIHNAAGATNLIGSAFGTYNFIASGPAPTYIYIRNVGSGTTNITAFEIKEVLRTEVTKAHTIAQDTSVELGLSQTATRGMEMTVDGTAATPNATAAGKMDSVFGTEWFIGTDGEEANGITGRIVDKQSKDTTSADWFSRTR